MDIEVRAVFSVPAASLWSVLGDPARVDWVVGVESCEMEGDVRHFRMAGAGDLRERIHACDDSNRRLVYGVIESPAPLTAHEASMSVLDHPDGCELVWTTHVLPDEFGSFIETSMHGCIEQMKQVVGA